MPKKRIALFGGSFNPPHLNHRKIVIELTKQFDEVIVVPCGYREDKETVSDMTLHHRAVMCGLCFGGIPRVRLDCSDLEWNEYTSTVLLQHRYKRPDVELWHVIGTDLWNSDGSSVIRQSWSYGQVIWETFNWLIVDRCGYSLEDGYELPPNHMRESICCREISSSDIRYWLMTEKQAGCTLPENVAAYIKRHALYQGKPSSSVTSLVLPYLCPHLFVDQYNPLAKQLGEALAHRSRDIDSANVILAIGGDGTMLRAVHALWSRRLPFIGLNTGHAGFLMNQIQAAWEESVDLMMIDLVHTTYTCYQLPLLSLTWVDGDGVRHRTHAFNDVYVKNADPTVAAQMDINVRSHSREWRFDGVIGDGLVCASEAGSTGYAFQAGAEPLPLSADGKWLLKGISARRVPQVNLDTDSVVTCRLGSSYRKCLLCADNRMLGPVTEFTVCMSNSGSVELAFLPGTDLVEKRIDLVMPI